MKRLTKRPGWVKIILLLALTIVLGSCGPTPAPTQPPVEPTEAAPPEPTATEAKPTDTPPPAEKKILRMGMIASPKTLNPFLSDYSYDHEAVVYAHCKLGQFAPDLTVVPYLADWDLSEDGTTYTFHINKDARWHDGEPVTAKDVVFTYKLIADPDSGAIYFDRVKDIKGMQAFHDGEANDVEGLKVIDDKTVQMTLEAPSASFLALSQSSMFILPEHILGSIDVKDVMDAPYWRNPVGCGPYKWGEYVTDQYIRYEKFPDFFLGEPKIDEIYIRMGSWETLEAAFEASDLDFVAVEPTEIQRFEGMDFATLHRGESYVDSLVINTQRPFLGDIKFRKAMMYGIDRESLINSAFFGYAQIAPNAFVTPWTLSPNITEYTYDPEKARELLEEVGWDGSIDFKFNVPTDLPHYDRMTLIIQQNLADLGIETHIEKAEGATIIEAMSKGDYDMEIMGYGTMSLLPQAAVNYFGADSLPPDGANWSWYEDQELTDLFAKAGREMDEDARTQIFYQITERMTDRVPMLPLAVEEVVVAINNRVHIPNVVYVPRNRPGDMTWITWNIYEWDVME